MCLDGTTRPLGTRVECVWLPSVRTDSLSRTKQYSVGLMQYSLGQSAHYLMLRASSTRWRHLQTRPLGQAYALVKGALPPREAGDPAPVKGPGGGPAPPNVWHFEAFFHVRCLL